MVQRTAAKALALGVSNMAATKNRTVAVYGAYGHTGRFVAAELRRRGWTPVLSGRDGAKLNAVAAELNEGAVRPAALDDPVALDRAFDDVAAIINCAGPFANTVAPVIEAALRARMPYLDVAAEIEANLDTFAEYAVRARAARTVAVPAMAFFGGLGDLLATTAMGEWTEADEIAIAYGLDSWKPTAGTLGAGRISRERRGGRRLVFANGRFNFRDDAPPASSWPFPSPLGEQRVIGEFTMADTLTISRHIRVPEIRSYMTVAAIKDLTAPNASPPVIEATGHSAQTFVVDVVVRNGPAERRAIARGQDIYAVTAPLVVEAAARVIDGRVMTSGAVTAGEAFDARDFLEALSPTHLTFELFEPEKRLVSA